MSSSWMWLCLPRYHQSSGIKLFFCGATDGIRTRTPVRKHAIQDYPLPYTFQSAGISPASAYLPFGASGTCCCDRHPFYRALSNLELLLHVLCAGEPHYSRCLSSMRTRLLSDKLFFDASFSIQQVALAERNIPAAKRKLTFGSLTFSYGKPMQRELAK